ncbi:MAG: hypothetical protein JWM95_550 [Gemmatimonadetes bacterium]|nr:hypothetical protein [Gemmatimonadota bacterium]
MAKGANDISVSTLRDDLPELLARVAFNGETFTIIKHGKKYATIRPYNEDDEARVEAKATGGSKKAKRASGSS